MLYLYVHELGETFSYPSTRALESASHVAERYLECALVQVASLKLRDIDCEVVLATNISDRSRLGRRGARLLGAIESLGVRLLPTPYLHRPGDGSSAYVSSRYVLDAILEASAGQPAERMMWMTDLDCVWVDPQLAFAAAPPPGEVAAIYIDYPPDWDTVGFGELGRTRLGIGEMAVAMGGPVDLPNWVGGEVFAGTAGDLREMVAAVERLDVQLAEEGRFLPTEEQIVSLAAALGIVRLRELKGVAWRIFTGPRHRAVLIDDPGSLGLWHLPSEKGLSLRRTARQIRRGRTAGLKRDLRDPARLARRFNVAGTGVTRRAMDDLWLAAYRTRSAIHTLFRPGGGPRSAWSGH